MIVRIAVEFAIAMARTRGTTGIVKKWPSAVAFVGKRAMTNMRTK
jgi:hypothetical protein